MAKIAIYGSCVTRDAFEVRPHPHEIVGYFARSSFISQVAPPIPYTAADIGDEVSPWAARMVEADLDKTVVEQIVKTEPDLVIIDLIDERLRLLRFGDSVLTASPYALQTPFVRALFTTEPKIAATDPQRDVDFTRAAPAVMGRLLEHIEPERILVHRATYSMRVRGKGRFDRTMRASSKRMNGLLGPWYDSLVAASGCRQYRAPWRERVADPDHKWGLSPFHYAVPYYERFLDHLETIDVARR